MLLICEAFGTGGKSEQRSYSHLALDHFSRKRNSVRRVGDSQVYPDGCVVPGVAGLSNSSSILFRSIQPNGKLLFCSHLHMGISELCNIS
jgi:hypothetical protein